MTVTRANGRTVRGSKGQTVKRHVGPRPPEPFVFFVVTRNKKYVADGCLVVTSIEEGLSIAKKNKEKETFIIGGGEIYKLALELNLVDKIYLTRVHAKFEGDTFFPNLSENWKEVKRVKCHKDQNHKYS